MRRILKRVSAFILSILAMVCLLSGCMLNPGVENLLSPPRAEGELGEIQLALEKYIAGNEKVGSVQGYSLKYPKTGDNRSAFVLNPNNATEAVVFYMPTDSGVSHINYLSKKSGKWISVGDIQGKSNDIDRIEFLDIDGDGDLEILVGWEVDFRDKIALIYRFENDEVNEWILELYNELVVANFIGDSKDNVVTLYANVSEALTTANIWSSHISAETNGLSVSSIGMTYLDGSIKSFSKPILQYNDKVGNHIYVDGALANMQATELIYWDRKNKQLIAPFYDVKENASVLTYRDSLVPCLDIDGDGVIEWPSVSPVLSTEGEKSSKVYLTKWFRWSFDNRKEEQVSTGILNLEDSYFFKTQPSWSMVLPEYNASQNQLVLSVHDNMNIRRELLKLKTINKGEKSETNPLSDSDSSALGDSQKMDILFSNDRYDYMVWFDSLAPTHFTLQDINKYFVSLSENN